MRRSQCITLKHVIEGLHGYQDSTNLFLFVVTVVAMNCKVQRGFIVVLARFIFNVFVFSRFWKLYEQQRQQCQQRKVRYALGCHGNHAPVHQAYPPNLNLSWKKCESKVYYVISFTILMLVKNLFRIWTAFGWGVAFCSGFHNTIA